MRKRRANIPSNSKVVAKVTTVPRDSILGSNYKIMGLEEI